MFEALPEKFQIIFREHYPSVLWRLMALSGDRSVAEDLTQEVFLRLYRRPPDDLAALPAWLHRVSSNVANDHFRKKIQERKLEERERSTLVEPSEPASDWLVLRNAERETVKTVLRQLSERDRQVLLLKHSGYSYAEIADIIGVDTKIIGTVLKRALARFKKKYLGEEADSHDGKTSTEGSYTV